MPSLGASYQQNLPEGRLQGLKVNKGNSSEALTQDFGGSKIIAISQLLEKVPNDKSFKIYDPLATVEHKAPTSISLLMQGLGFRFRVYSNQVPLTVEIL